MTVSKYQQLSLFDLLETQIKNCHSCSKYRMVVDAYTCEPRYKICCNRETEFCGMMPRNPDKVCSAWCSF